MADLAVSLHGGGAGESDEVSGKTLYTLIKTKIRITNKIIKSNVLLQKQIIL